MYDTCIQINDQTIEVVLLGEPGPPGPDTAEMLEQLSSTEGDTVVGTQTGATLRERIAALQAAIDAIDTSGGGGGDATIRSELLATSGDTMVGTQDGSTLRVKIAAQNASLALKASKDYDPPYAGGVTHSLISRLGNFVFADDFCVGDGTTDDAAKLQLALNTGKRVWLDPAKTYAFGSQLTPPSNGGFIGGGKLLVLTGTGKFDYLDYTGTATAKAGIYINAKTNVKVEAVIEMQTNAGIRTANAIRVDSSTNVRLDVECLAFKEPQAGIIEWNSNSGGRVDAYIHDCGTTITTGLPSIQISGLSVDNNRIGGVNSKDLRFDVRVKNITQSAGSITAYGSQTDGVNLQGTGSSDHRARHQGKIIADNVLEPLDVFCNGCVIDVTAVNCYFGVKLTHGASHNIITANIDLFQKAGVYIEGGATADGQGCAYNDVRATVTRGGEVGSLGDVTGALLEGSGGTYGADYNNISINATGNGTNFDYIAQVNGGTGNTITYEGSGFAVQATKDYTATSAGNVFKRRRPALVRAYLSASTSYAADTTVIFNTEEIDRHGEFNPATGVYTAKSNCTLRVKYGAAGASIAAGGNFGSYIRKGGVTVSRKTDVNMGASARDLPHEHSAIVTVAPGDTIFIRTDTSASVSHYGGTSATYLEIVELG